jgi:hypothetical protein
LNEMFHIRQQHSLCLEKAMKTMKAKSIIICKVH